MMTRRLLLIVLAALWAGCQVGPQDRSVSHPTTSGGQCKISLVDESHGPEFSVLESALELPEPGTCAKAYFAMGCFWSSEGLIASAPGVVSTRVGFSGGTLPNPSYSAIGDHVETVEVLYDPAIISYPELLRHFWHHHNARAKPIFRQYASAIFCLDESELRVAKEERTAWEAKGTHKVLTAILPAGKFYPAAENHQKYYLQQDPKLLQSLPTENRLTTTLAAKLNAVSGRTGDRKDLEQALENLGIDQKARAALFSRAMW